MIRAIVFDCFGVLVGPGFWNIYRHAGGDPRHDWEFIDELLYLANTATITKEEFGKRVSEHLGISVEKFTAVTNEYEVPNLDIFDYIRDELKPKYKLAILSNANSGTLQRKIPQELLDLFDVVAVSGEIGVIKPQPQAYQYVCDKLGVQPSEAVFIDDQERYVAPAAELGMRVVQFSSTDKLKQALHDLTEEQ